MGAVDGEAEADAEQEAAGDGAGDGGGEAEPDDVGAVDHGSQVGCDGPLGKRRAVVRKRGSTQRRGAHGEGTEVPHPLRAFSVRSVAPW